MSKKLGGILVVIVGAGLLLYSMARTFHLLSETLPAGQEVLAAVALLSFDLGLVAWSVVFLRGAEGGLQRAIALIMVIVDLVGVIAGFLGDTLMTSGDQGLLDRMGSAEKQTIVLITAGIIAANIAATIFYHLASPENLRRMTEEAARDKIQNQALAAIAQQANLLAEELAPIIAADWVRNMRADFSAPLTETKQLTPPKNPSTVDELQKAIAPAKSPNGTTFASTGTSDAPQVEIVQPGSSLGETLEHDTSNPKGRRK